MKAATLLRLTSYGTLKIDQDSLISCTSTENKQLLYENHEVRLLADLFQKRRR